MTRTTSRPTPLAARARKSPLRTATMTVPADSLAGPPAADLLLATGRGVLEPVAAPELRRMQISEFADWLRCRTNRNKRPFQEATVAAYCDAARSLDRWMSEQDIDGDFTACDTAMLNRFFTSWVTRHGQTGLNTRQRNLRHLFTWLEEAYEHPHPYTAALHRYAPLTSRPSTLAQAFITDLLEVTGGGRARSFGDARDHAMIRVLTEGVRRTELIQLELPDLSADLIARPFVRVVPLKSARAFTEGRIVPLTPATSRALANYLRVRRTHRLASLSPALWLGTRNRGPLIGIGQMTGFGQVYPLPGIWSSFHIDTAVTLPIGVEAYAAFALRAWLTSSPAVSERTRRFARASAVTALILGMAGQAAYHLLTQAGVTRAPWEVTTLVSALPVLVLGLGLSCLAFSGQGNCG